MVCGGKIAHFGRWGTGLIRILEAALRWCRVIERTPRLGKLANDCGSASMMLPDSDGYTAVCLPAVMVVLAMLTLAWSGSGSRSRQCQAGRLRLRGACCCRVAPRLVCWTWEAVRSRRSIPPLRRSWELPGRRTVGRWPSRSLGGGWQTAWGRICTCWRLVVTVLWSPGQVSIRCCMARSGLRTVEACSTR